MKKSLESGLVQIVNFSSWKDKLTTAFENVEKLKQQRMRELEKKAFEKYQKSFLRYFFWLSSPPEQKQFSPEMIQNHLDKYDRCKYNSLKSDVWFENILIELKVIASILSVEDNGIVYLSGQQIYLLDRWAPKRKE